MSITEGKWRLLAIVLACGLLTGPLSVVFARAASAATASDTFDRANGALGANWTTTPGLAAPQISGNTVRAGTANSVNSAYWSATTFGRDQFSSGTMPASSGASNGPGLAVRLSGTKGYFLWYGNSAGTVSLWRMDSASSWTQLKTSAALSVTPATDVWKIQVTAGQGGQQRLQRRPPDGRDLHQRPVLAGRGDLHSAQRRTVDRARGPRHQRRPVPGRGQRAEPVQPDHHRAGLPDRPLVRRQPGQLPACSTRRS